MNPKFDMRNMRKKVRFTAIVLCIVTCVFLVACDPFSSMSIKHDLHACLSIGASGLNSGQAEDILKAIDPITKTYGFVRNDCGETKSDPDPLRKYLACYKGVTGKSPFFDVVVIEHYQPESIQIIIYGWVDQIRSRGQDVLRQFEEVIQRGTVTWGCS